VWWVFVFWRVENKYSPVWDSNFANISQQARWNRFFGLFWLCWVSTDPVPCWVSELVSWGFRGRIQKDLVTGTTVWRALYTKGFALDADIW
jgi:hypothetical protein